MKIKIYNKNQTDYYELEYDILHPKGIWISHNGEGIKVDIDKISDVLYDALDKFYKDNFNG